MKRRGVRTLLRPPVPPVAKHAVKGRVPMKQQRRVERWERRIAPRGRGGRAFRIGKGLQSSRSGREAAASRGGRVLVREEALFGEEVVLP